jgi:hypothetical protein
MKENFEQFDTSESKSESMEVNKPKLTEKELDAKYLVNLPLKEGEEIPKTVNTSWFRSRSLREALDILPFVETYESGLQKVNAPFLKGTIERMIALRKEGVDWSDSRLQKEKNAVPDGDIFMSKVDAYLDGSDHVANHPNYDPWAQEIHS